MISIVIIAVLGFATMMFFEDFYFEKREREIMQNSMIFLDFIAEAMPADDWLEISRWLMIISRLNQGQAWLIDHSGHILLSHPGEWAEGDYHIQFANLQHLLRGEVITQRVGSPFFERPMLLVGLPMLDIEFSGGLLVFSPVAGIRSTILHVQRLMGYAALLALILAMFFALLWSRSMSAPLNKVSKFALELGKGDYGKTIDLKKRTVEINNLVASFNTLSLKLDTTISDLIEERNKLDYILSGMEEGVLAINNQQRIILINNSFSKLMKLPPKGAILDRKLEEIVDHQGLIDLYRKVLQEERPLEKDFFVGKEQNQVRLSIRCAPIFQKDQVWGVVGLCADVSEKWRFDQLQKKFVANVSHDIKTPLSSMKGAAELLKDNVVKDSKDREKYLQIIIEETEMLAELVEKILYLEKFEFEATAKKREIVEVQELLENIGFLFVQSKGIPDDKLSFNLSYQPLFVKVNTNDLKRVLLNLLDNAHKFSPLNSAIELGAKPENNQVCFWVKDEGSGIKTGEERNIWERFYKLDQARTKTKKGHGLGLAIVKETVEGYDGQVFVKRNKERGMTFGFYLKQAKLGDK